ncbi:peptidase G2 autoproteolytic cleavage domain-containing protein [Chengkuizengella sp. SCS-71B]|uniref:peptidase G2 autoproteolytic cleavage domain-containing protein n=1 Tax=Chengkuizengella sp. SCS-71B TaxID=3115290 RepID=UPI0039B74385
MGRSGQAIEDNSWHLVNGTLMALINGNTGDACFAGQITSGRGCDFAELFETLDGNPIDVGYFVTTEGDKIKKATDKDNYILGVTSGFPAVLGGSGYEWNKRYLTGKWGQALYEEVTIPAEKDENGKIISPERIEKRQKLNPEYDPDKQYIPRSERPEWVAVGLTGQLLVRDDGTSEVNGFCRPNADGIATIAQSGYRVLKRTDEDQILIIVANPMQIKNDSKGEVRNGK